MVIGLQIRKLHGGAESAPPPAVLDSKKPGLFRVNKLLLKQDIIRRTSYNTLVKLIDQILMLSQHGNKTADV